MTSSAQKLGEVISGLVHKQQLSSQNRNGQSIKTTKRRIIYNTIKLPSSVTLIKKVPLSTSFLVNHPVQGVVNSNTLLINGGYDSSQEETLSITNF